MKRYGILLLQWIVVLGATVTGGGAAAADETLPPVQHGGRVSYLSGGVGLDESRAMQNAMGGYPLVLTFVHATHQDRNEYLANVPVIIRDAQGKVVLDASSDGPYMLVFLPNGRYKISASYQGKSEQREVAIRQSGRVRQTFIWPT